MLIIVGMFAVTIDHAADLVTMDTKTTVFIKACF
jgi:hypothetical protein